MRTLLSILVFALLTFTACKQAETNEETATTEEYTETVTKESADHTKTFNERIAVLRAFFKAHCDENIEAQKAMLADTLKFSSPKYSETPWQGKEEFLAVIKGYHDNFEDISYTEGIVLPNNTVSGFFSGNHYSSDGTVNSGANSIRCYGTWKGKHSESGKTIGVKFFSVASFNEDNKIVMMTDYWNLDGLAAQIAAE